ncbi:ABC transporter permease [Aureimonas sp. AU22]|uniref:ABC transporter permease n=1 Tax=Aureimonas sp. AU22 TaxID=1638162 RepID=UPI000781AF10|nr:ABC transporter permease [Aureimonas sp. AU22]
MSALLDGTPARSWPGRIRAKRRPSPVWLALVPILAAAFAPFLLGRAGLDPDLSARLLPPIAAHPFGTDALGRDMLARTLQGLAVSLRIGLLAAGVSAAIALLLALASTLSRAADAAVSFLVDAALSLPHLVALILIAFALGGGAQAVAAAVALTHWPRLARILRAELLAVLRSDYVAASRRFGRSRLFVAGAHVLPHLLPQLGVGLVLLFPHAILHEAALTFLGFGLEPSKPAIGVLLADAMRTLSAGRWWLAVFPGLALLALALCFETVGGALRRRLDPRGAA